MPMLSITFLLPRHSLSAAAQERSTQERVTTPTDDDTVTLSTAATLIIDQRVNELSY